MGERFDYEDRDYYDKLEIPDFRDSKIVQGCLEL